MGVLDFLRLSWELVLASWWYLKSTDIPEQLAERYADLYRILTHKYYVDEFYDWLIVRPLHVVSEKFLWRVVDAGAIDNVLVNGTGETRARRGRCFTAASIRQHHRVTPPGFCWARFCGLLYIFANQYSRSDAGQGSILGRDCDSNTDRSYLCPGTRRIFSRS